MLGIAASVAAFTDATPLARAHAHNDYLHPRPLLVAHDQRDVMPERTLRALYLEPLRRIVHERAGRVLPGYPGSLLLLVDIKSDAVATYRALHEQLRGYEAILTVARGSEVRTGPVSVVISGNRPRELMQREAIRYAGYDGRLADLGSATAAAFMPLISDNWMLHFRWMGDGPMPDDERTDDLGGLRQFLLQHDPAPSAPHR